MTPYYDDGQVVIYHGDCRDVLPTLGTVEAIVTDPPYGIDYQHGTRKGGRRLGQDGEAIVGDQEPFSPLHLLHWSVPTVMWGANHYADLLPSSRGWLVWDKRDGRPANDQSDAEMAWTNFLTVARVFSRYWSGNVRTGREQTEGRFHVNQKPVALMHWCLSLLPAVVAVADPYMGSGTTLVAAKERGLRAVGVEIDERHCEVAARRLSHNAFDFGDVEHHAEAEPA